MTDTMQIPPDITKILVAFLRAQPEVTALITGTQIRGEMGKKPTYPLVRITRITDVAEVTDPPILETVTVQLDCYGGNNRQAERIASTIKAVTTWRGAGAKNDEGTITKVVSRGMIDSPDDSQDPPRQRYILTLDITIRADNTPVSQPLP